MITTPSTLETCSQKQEQSNPPPGCSEPFTGEAGEDRCGKTMVRVQQEDLAFPCTSSFLRFKITFMAVVESLGGPTVVPGAWCL